MKETIALTLTLLAFGCSLEDVGEGGDAIEVTDAPPPTPPDVSDAGPGSDCTQLICHEYGGGIEECVCADDVEPVEPDDGPPDLGTGPEPVEPDPDPYAE